MVCCSERAGVLLSVRKNLKVNNGFDCKAPQTLEEVQNKTTALCSYGRVVAMQVPLNKSVGRWEGDHNAKPCLEILERMFL